jgi:hypothetical protein
MRGTYFSLLRNIHTKFGVHQEPIYWIRGKTAGAWNWPRISIQEWCIYICTLRYILIRWCLIKHRDKFYLYFYEAYVRTHTIFMLLFRNKTFLQKTQKVNPVADINMYLYVSICIYMYHEMWGTESIKTLCYGFHAACMRVFFCHGFG